MAIKWSGWESLGKSREADIGSPFVQRNQDGRLEVFAIGLGKIFNRAQVAPNGGWVADWRDKSSPSPSVHIRLHVVGRNADGRQEIFAVAEDNALWHKWQLSPDNGWSEWKTLGTPTSEIFLTDRFTAGRNQDGRQEVFVLASDNNIWQIFQTAPNGGWSPWVKRGKPAPGVRSSDRITVGLNRDGRLEVFVMGEDAALWHVWQVAPNVGWSAWESLGKPRDRDFPEPKDRDISEPVVRENADGHLEVFAIGDGAFCNRWQEAPNSTIWRHQGWNAKPAPSSAVQLVSIEAALNFENRIEALGFGSDGALWHAWQIDDAPNWSHWQNLGTPPAKIRQTDRLTIGTNQDGRLEVFVAGQDGAVWHIWQIR